MNSFWVENKQLKNKIEKHVRMNLETGEKNSNKKMQRNMKMKYGLPMLNLNMKMNIQK